jgi:arylsulfatase A-like enzyme
MQLIQQTKKNHPLFLYLLLLTFFFIIIEISFLIQLNGLYLGDYKLISDRLKIPDSIIPGILYFIFIQLCLHFAFTVVIWGMARLIGSAFYFSWKTVEKLGFGFWFLGILTIITANEYLYPNSKFASLTSYIFHHRYAGFFLSLFASLMLIVCILSILSFLIVSSKKIKITVAGLGAIIAAPFLFNHFHSPATIDAATVDKPNIIFIGIDSLRPDFLGYFGYKQQRTPYLDEFLNQSAVFSDAVTPIARTFPSWVSILTGEYPKHNGVRFNLPDMSKFDWQSTLPAILRQHGYETIFSTDEVRFSNIDERFGFDKVVTPPEGFNDFLIGSMNDFPLSNLFVNTAAGKYLFPHSFGNRPAIDTYDPDSFLKLLEPTLATSRSKPLFFAVHFCLPHFPYYWGKAPFHTKSIDNYRDSVHRVDQQFRDLLVMLKKYNLLQHSIVVVLSDHGEAIELPGDRATDASLFIPGPGNKKAIIPQFYPKSFDYETLNQTAGHGTDILGLPQYHTVLAFRLFGLDFSNQTEIIPNFVSLMDIKPTILQFLHIPINHNDDGNVLTDLILNQKTVPLAQKDFFMETDFSPASVRTVHPETRNVLFEGITFFQIDPITTRLTVKKSMADLIISSKQYADVYGNWILALNPQNKSYMTPILVNLETGLWTNDLRTPFAKASPAAHMLLAMKNFYGNDITEVR